MTSICIVAQNAFGVMTGDTSKHVGGVEIQTRLLAERLSGMGYDVTVVTWNEGDSARCELLNVQLRTVCGRDDGFPVLRFIHPRWTSLNKALANADSDIYFQSGAEYCTGQIAMWCRRHKKKFVFSIASDMDCDAKLPLLRSVRERVLYRLGLRLADRVFTQTRKQRNQLKRDFGVESVYLPMPCKLSGRSVSSQNLAKTKSRKQVLMVCRVTRIKNIEMYLEVAKGMPDVQFVLVGPLDDDEDYGRFIRCGIESLANISWPGAAGGEELLDYYKNASIFCCTSKFEGFPNTFLEAWAHGLPVISAVDPDGLIKEQELGAHVSSVPAMVKTIRELLASPDHLASIGHNCTQYFQETHDPDTAVRRYAAEFQGLRDAKD